MKLLCLDSNSILNRAFYGIKLLSTKDGVYTNAIFGYMNIFKKLLDEVRPDAVACAFDLRAPTFRHKMYDGYKAQRKGMPEELAMQLPLVQELLQHLGYKIVQVEGYEADDILGTFCALCERQGAECVIATGDRDSLQLVSGQTTVLLASTKMGKPATTVCTPQYIKETYGIEPRQLIDVKSLMGDSSDNIPGVSGIGEKGALGLISKSGSLQALYQNLDSLGLSPKLREKLEAGRESAFMSYELATICREVPLDGELSHYLPGEPDYPAAAGLLSRLQMFSLIKRLEIPEGAAAAAPASEEAVPAAPASEEAVPAAPLCKEVADGSAQDLGALLAEKERVLDLCPLIAEDALRAFAIDTDGKVLRFTEDLPDYQALAKKLLESPNPKRVRDLKALYRYAYKNDINLQNVIFDLELAAYLLSPNSTEYTVGQLMGEYALPSCEAVFPDGEEEPEPPEKPKGKKPAGDPLRALCRDCAQMGALCDKLQSEVEQGGLSTVLDTIELPLAGVLAAMELWGFRVDGGGIEEFGKALDGDIAGLEESIYALAGEQFNINSPKQLGEILFEKLGLPARRKTKSGYSTDAAVLESLEDYHLIVPQILEYRKLTKLKSTYVDGLLKVVGPDGRIHSVFRQTETRTGRISSTEPNMQNIPVRTKLGSQMRRFFVCEPGWVLLDADYSQIELRVLAHISGDKAMREAFRTGEDIHTQTAAQVFDLPPLMVTPEMRSRAKAVNFGIVYGIGAFSLAKNIGVSVAEADRYIKSYLATYSGVKRYMDETVEKAKRDGYVTTILGRRRYLPELQSSNKNIQAFGKRVAMNTPIQGTAADIIKLAMIKVYNRLKKENMRARLILQVHDELIVEAPKDEQDRAGMILREEMENAVHLAVDMKVDLGAGESWYDAK
ncbi:MAG: DNA polymerase I [Clostridiales bacterium]|nr:MAG: DNA polymerase I [Clostridiales bacterium]